MIHLCMELLKYLVWDRDIGMGRAQKTYRILGKISILNMTILPSQELSLFASLLCSAWIVLYSEGKLVSTSREVLFVR